MPSCEDEVVEPHEPQAGNGDAAANGKENFYGALLEIDVHPHGGGNRVTE